MKNICVGKRKKRETYRRTWATEAVILVPPAAPVTSFTRPALSTTITGVIEDRGLFRGSTRFTVPYNNTLPSICLILLNIIIKAFINESAY